MRSLPDRGARKVSNATVLNAPSGTMMTWGRKGAGARKSSPEIRSRPAPARVIQSSTVDWFADQNSSNTASLASRACTASSDGSGNPDSIRSCSVRARLRSIQRKTSATGGADSRRRSAIRAS